jgi:hypothetical protein
VGPHVHTTPLTSLEALSVSPSILSCTARPSFAFAQSVTRRQWLNARSRLTIIKPKYSKAVAAGASSATPSSQKKRTCFGAVDNRKCGQIRLFNFKSGAGKQNITRPACTVLNPTGRRTRISQQKSLRFYYLGHLVTLQSGQCLLSAVSVLGVSRERDPGYSRRSR